MKLRASDGTLVRADVTTEHPCSSYHQPVLVLEDGQTLGVFDVAVAGWTLAEATDAEQQLLEKGGFVISGTGGSVA